MGRSPQQDGGKHRKSTGNKTPFPNGLGQPALRALASAGYDHLEQLAGCTRIGSACITRHWPQRTSEAP